MPLASRLPLPLLDPRLPLPNTTVGDVVTSANGVPLSRGRSLHHFLRDEFVVAGDRVRLGLVRSLDAHIALVMQQAMGGADDAGRTGDSVRKGSAAAAAQVPSPPPMERRARLDVEERLAAYRKAGGRPVRDPYNGRLVQPSQWANSEMNGRSL